MHAVGEEQRSTHKAFVLGIRLVCTPITWTILWLCDARGFLRPHE